MAGGDVVISLAFVAVLAPFLVADHVLNADARAQKLAEERACFDRLASSLPSSALGPMLGTAITSAFGARGLRMELAVGNEAPAPGHVAAGKQQLTASLPILHLRKSARPDELAVEIGLQVRIHAVESARVAYESLLVFAEDFPDENPLMKRSRLYERIVAAHPQPRPLAEWCGAGGPALFSDDVRTGMNAIAAQLAQDLAAGP